MRKSVLAVAAAASVFALAAGGAAFYELDQDGADPVLSVTSGLTIEVESELCEGPINISFSTDADLAADTYTIDAVSVESATDCEDFDVEVLLSGGEQTNIKYLGTFGDFTGTPTLSIASAVADDDEFDLKTDVVEEAVILITPGS
jgi:hypothetical protein